MPLAVFRTGLICALLASPVALWAADENGKFAVDGVGARSCADFTSVKDKPEGARAFAGWTEGFITAYNIYTAKTFDVTPWQPVELLVAKMGKFCEKNPDVPYINGLSALIRTLEPGRMVEEDKFVSVRHSGKSVFLYTSTLDQLRVDLNAAGFEAGAEGAPYDDTFINAVRAFQESKGLTLTGLPDAPTMNVLYP